MQITPLCAHRKLPFVLDQIIAPNLLGLAVINSGTFAADLALLTAMHGGLRGPGDGSEPSR